MITILILLFLSGLFSATETAYTSLSLLDRKELELSHTRSAKNALYFIDRGDLFLTTVLICNNIVNISLSALVTKLTIEYWGNSYVGYATGILTLTLLLFGEISPKHIALSKGRQIAQLMAIPMRVLATVLLPVISIFRLFTLFLNLFLKESGKNALTATGLMHITDAAEDLGVVDEYESVLMQKAIHFSDTSVKTVMTHRTEVFMLSDTLSPSEALNRIVSSGYSRVPLYHERRENITGILLLKDLLKHKQQKILKTAIKPFFIPEGMALDDLFRQFKKQRIHVAIVLDEYGGFSGMVSMEDLVEVLFGEIYDEHEVPEGELITQRGQNRYLVQGEIPYQYLVDRFSLNVDEKKASGYSTVAGYLLDQLGDIPKPGQVIDTEEGRYKVNSMIGRKIDTLLFTPNSERNGNAR